MYFQTNQNTSLMKNSIFILALSFFFFSSQTASTQSIVDEQVVEIGLILALDGYELTHDLKYASLNNGRNDNYYFSLDRGWSYHIYSVCDGDCGDIDLCLYDENGNEIDCDETSDDKPLVSVTPKWSGRFRLKVSMYECRINPCRFAIAVFGK